MAQVHENSALQRKLDELEANVGKLLADEPAVDGINSMETITSSRVASKISFFKSLLTAEMETSRSEIVPGHLASLTARFSVLEAAFCNRTRDDSIKDDDLKVEMEASCMAEEENVEESKDYVKNEVEESIDEEKIERKAEDGKGGATGRRIFFMVMGFVVVAMILAMVACDQMENWMEEPAYLVPT